MRVEVEDDALRGLRRRDDPVAVLVRRVLQRITWGGDVTRLAGIEDAPALGHCDRDRRVGVHREVRVIDCKTDETQEQSSQLRLFLF